MAKVRMEAYMDVDYADLSDGYKLFIKGAEFPMKGKPMKQEEIANFNLLKRIMMEGLRLFLALPKAVFSPRRYLESVIEAFNAIAERLIGPMMMPTNLMSPFSRELELFLTIFLIELAIEPKKAFPLARNVAQIFERDEAYRWRAQDLLTLSNPRALFTRKELKLLGRTALERNDVGQDNKRVGEQTVRFINLLRLALFIPRVKKALTKAIRTINYGQLIFDEGDRYWAYFKLDYNFDGLTPQERMAWIKRKGYKIPFVTQDEKGEV